MKEIQNPKMKQSSPPNLEILVEYTKIFFSAGYGRIKDVKLLEPLDIKKVKKSYEINGKKVEYRKGLDHEQVQMQIKDVRDILEVPKDGYILVGIIMFDLFMNESDLFLSG